jgi:hypothetical protein
MISWQRTSIILYFMRPYSPFVVPWPLFQFRNRIHSPWDSLDGGSALRKAATYTQDNTEKTYTNFHASSGIRTHGPRVWTDRAATVTGISVTIVVFGIGSLRFWLQRMAITCHLVHCCTAGGLIFVPGWKPHIAWGRMCTHHVRCAWECFSL